MLYKLLCFIQVLISIALKVEFTILYMHIIVFLILEHHFVKFPAVQKTYMHVLGIAMQNS